MGEKSYIGAKVRLNRDFRTRGGTTFKQGVIMKVAASTSAGLTLGCWVRGWYEGISCVRKHDVTVVEWPEPKGEEQ
jgi:hypothetical protein